MIDIEGRGGYCSVHCYFIFSKGKRAGVVLLVPKRGDDYVFICIHIKQSNSVNVNVETLESFYYLY